MRLALVLAILVAPLSAAELTLTFVPRWQGAPLTVPSAPVVNNASQVLRLTRFSALVSGVMLVRTDGSAAQLDGQFGFLDAENGRLAVTLRNVPPGDYAGLQFQFGLPEAINHADPSRWPAGHPLNPIVNSLHWGWTGGYIFTALEGRWRDASAAGEERGFSYHLATDARLMTMRFVSLIKIDGDTTVALALDFAKVLGPLKLATDDGSESTHSGKHDELAPRLTAAMQRAFFFLETTPTKHTATSATPVASAAAFRGATPFVFPVPAGFPQPELPADNPLTVEGIALGEELFYDQRLSARGVQSCATCHEKERGFTDGQRVSTGADGAKGTRSAMPLFNLAWSPAFTWDGGKPHVRDQALAAMTNPTEMHADPAGVVATLGRDEKLRAKFAAAFGTPEISAERIGLALEQYLLTLVSADSKLDRALRGGPALTDDEKRGFELFLTEYDPVRGRSGGDCFHCHGGALFTDFGFKNNGLDATPRDAGRNLVTSRDSDRGKFKTPSLRNVALTAPYMHDGRFATLEDVIAHYDHGVARSATLDPNIAKHPDAGLQLSADDQRALVAFLKTLTDPRFSP